MNSTNRTERNDINAKSLMLMMNNESIIDRAIACLGKGFDLTNDFRFKYCKGNERLILLNEDHTTQLFVPGFGTLNDLVSVDIKCDKGDITRHQSDILDFNQMSELLNRKSRVGGKIPTGLFNAMYNFESGCWATDAGNTKLLGFDGYSVVLFNLHIDRYPLILSHQLRNSIPSTWDPPALARFIEKYGTHIIVGISIGGEDMVLLKQNKSSKLAASELKKHLYELGDQLFTGTCTIFPQHHRTKQLRQKAPSAFNVFEQLSNNFSTITSKDGITVICTKRGGDLSVTSHSEWLTTVPSMPDAINFTFIPITSLLKGAPGKGFLSHAINLYLRYKPPIGELEYFLDFQSHRTWAPLHSDLPLTPTTNMPLPESTLHFNIIGPKLYVNTSQVYVDQKKPVTGMRLYLEGMKCDRLAVHLQHLSNIPTMFHNKIGDTQYWRGSDELTDNERYLEPVQNKKLSHICSAPVKYNPTWSQQGQENVTFIVTGAQLCTKKHGTKHVLHLRLLFSPVSCFKIVESNWAQCEQDTSSQKLKFLSSISPPSSGNLEREKEELIVIDSSQFPTGPPVPIQNQKLLKYVDTSQVCRGPQDMPGYWLITGAKLDIVKGKISLQVKFSLLNICS